jgi:hypothetical protein
MEVCHRWGTVIYKVTCVSCAVNDSRGIKTIVPSSAMIFETHCLWPQRIRCGVRRNKLGGKGTHRS